MSTDVTSREERSAETLLSVDSLSVEFTKDDDVIRALRDVSIRLQPGETLGIAGESGSGKSTLAYAILRYLDENGRITSGDVTFQGRSLMQMSNSELQELRGNEIAHVAQNPQAALNPSIRAGEQIKETIELHEDVSDEEATAAVYEVLESVNIPDPEHTARRYPHELSGGQQQRVLLAIALSCNPKLLVLDEPTTGLDVTTQGKILTLIEELKDEYDVSILLITHNLGVIAQTADRVNILYAGEMMEKGPVEEVFTRPANPYTQGLLATTPELERNKDLTPIPGTVQSLTDVPDGCIFADRCAFVEEECRTGDIELETVRDESDHLTRCRRWETAIDDPITASTAPERSHTPGDPILEADGVSKHFGTPGLIDRLVGEHRPVKAVDGVDLTIHESETVGLVGESGCGKSTLGRTLLGLHDATDGTVRYRGTPLEDLSSSERTALRSECQIIFQEPESSLNPRKSVYRIIERPLKTFTDLDEAGRNDRIGELLHQVNLSPDVAPKYPHELSGGQQQRVAIARAFAANPSLVVLDEPVSSLDVSVQASILKLLDRLQDEYETAYLFISHDLSVVRSISDRIAVMYLGNVAEIGTTGDVFAPPYHPYTRSLLSNSLSIDPHAADDAIHLEGVVPSARDPPSGCPFHTRCPQKIGEECEREHPPLEPTGNGENGSHRISCLHDEAELSKSTSDVKAAEDRKPSSDVKADEDD